MTEATETVLQYLQRVRRKDEEKGGSGWRSTAEVQEFFDLKRSEALSRLKELEESRQIACAVDGSSYVWKAYACGDILLPRDDGGVEARFAQPQTPGVLTMTTESAEPCTWVEGWTFQGEVSAARVEDGKLKIEAKSGPIIMKIALPASTKFEPTTKTYPDGTKLTESRALYIQQAGRAKRPMPPTAVCDESVLTAGMVENPVSLPEAARAYLDALDAMDDSPTNAIAYTNQRDTLAECLADLRTAVAQVIP